MTIHQTTIRPAVTPAEQRFLDLYASVSAELPGAGSAAVRAWRDAARDAFIMLGVPHRRVEEWKYTDLRALMPDVYPLGGLDSRARDVSVEAAIGKSLGRIWTLIGRCSSAGDSVRTCLPSTTRMASPSSR